MALTPVAAEDLGTTIATYLPDNTSGDITPEDLRKVFTDVQEITAPLVARYQDQVHLSDFASLGYQVVDTAAPGDIRIEAMDLGGIDNAAAFNAAIAQMSATHPGTRLVLPGGVLPIGSEITLQARVSIEGAGRGQTVIFLQPDSNCHAMAGYQPGDEPILENVQLSHFCIHGNRLNQAPGDWDCLHFDMPTSFKGSGATGGVDPQFTLQHLKLMYGQRNLLHFVGGGDNVISHIFGEQSGRAGIYMNCVDQALDHIIVSATGEEGFLFDGADYLISNSLAYFTGMSHLGTISTAQDAAGQKERRQKGAAYRFNSGNVRMVNSIANDTLGSGVYIANAENFFFSGLTSQSIGTIGRGWPGIARSAAYALDPGDPANAVHVVEIDKATNCKTISGTINHSFAINSNRCGQFTGSIVHFQNSNLAASAYKERINVDIRHMHHFNDPNNIWAKTDPFQVFGTVKGVSWVSGNQVKFAGDTNLQPAAPGYTVTFEGFADERLNGTFEVISRAGYDVTVAVPGVTGAIPTDTGRFTLDVANLFVDDVTIEGGFQQDFSRSRITADGAVCPALASYASKDRFNGVVNGLAQEYRFTTTAQVQRSLTDVSYHKPGEALVRLNSGVGGTDRMIGLKISGADNPLLNGTFEVLTKSGSNGYILRHPGFVDNSMDATGLSASVVGPAPSYYTTEPGDLGETLRLVGEEIDPSNSVTVKLHQAAGATDAVVLTESGMEALLEFTTQGWKLRQPEATRRHDAPSGTTLSPMYGRHVVGLSANGSATLPAAAEAGHKVTVIVVEQGGSSPKLALTLAGAGGGVAQLGAGAHVFEWGSWTGGAAGWLKLS